MASKFKRRSRTEYTVHHIGQLQGGWDFFHAAFSDDIDAMREAWADPAVRERVRQTRLAKCYGTSFAEVAFGPESEGGMVAVASDLPAARAEYFRQGLNNQRVK